MMMHEILPFDTTSPDSFFIHLVNPFCFFCYFLGYRRGGEFEKPTLLNLLA